MPEAIVTSNGRITIPVTIRRAMSLGAGAKVDFSRLSDGTIVIRNKGLSVPNHPGTHESSPQAIS